MKINWDFWDGIEIPKEEIKKFYKISICTNSMNRLHDLQQTLPKNIEDNKDYPNIEFVVLNYGSSDGMDKWAKENLQEYIEKGLVNYYSILDTISFYSMTHSRNVAFKLAQGDIVNQVDADNFINKGFAAHINMFANIQFKKALYNKGRRLNHGRIGISKEDFLNLGGYDENLKGYGHDDHNLTLRAILSGFKFFWYGGKFCERIKTPKKEKVVNMQNKSWKYTEEINKKITEENLNKGILIANQNIEWGKARVLKNFKEEIVL